MKRLTLATRLLLVALLCMGLAMPAPVSAAPGETQVAWAKAQAQLLIDQMDALIADENYVTAFSPTADATEQLRRWRDEMLLHKPVVHVYSPPSTEDLMRHQG